MEETPQRPMMTRSLPATLLSLSKAAVTDYGVAFSFKNTLVELFSSEVIFPEKSTSVLTLRNPFYRSSQKPEDIIIHSIAAAAAVVDNDDDPDSFLSRSGILQFLVCIIFFFFFFTLII